MGIDPASDRNEDLNLEEVDLALELNASYRQTLDRPDHLRENLKVINELLDHRLLLTKKRRSLLTR